MFNLGGKVAVITGASGYLGSSFAEMLAKAGATVALVGRNKPKMEQVCRAIAAKGGKAFAFQCDIGKKKDVEKCVSAIAKKFRKIDVLVNNAAYIPDAKEKKDYFSQFEDSPEYIWEKAFRTNVMGAVFCSQSVGKIMLRQKSGSIINIASIYGIASPHKDVYKSLDFNNPAQYGATKAAVIMLTRFLASNWADRGIRVNCISPGGVFRSQDPRFVERYCNLTPMGRMAEPADIAAAVLFLSSDDSKYVNGHNVVVDGGWTSW